MFFGKKKEKQLPIDEIRNMASQGMGDRDIIKELKSRGFSYNEIEKAMLQAVKEGVEPEPKQFSPPSESFTPPLPEPPETEFELPGFEEPSAGEEDIGLEELIEGVIDEKWERFEDRISKIEDNFEQIKSEIKQFEMKMSQEKQSPTKELELRIGEISEQIDELDARVGGLEKAFKQFLPSLTRNVESLSQLIHEIKEKHEMVEEEA